MDTKRIFAYEYAACVGITSWGALKKGYAPWPPNIIYSTVALAVLSVVSTVNEKIAVYLSVGFLIALIVGQATGGKISTTFAALPPPGYDVLSLGSTLGAANAAATGPTAAPPTSTPQAAGPNQVIDPSTGKPLNIMNG